MTLLYQFRFCLDIKTLQTNARYKYGSLAKYAKYANLMMRVATLCRP